MEDTRTDFEKALATGTPLPAKEVTTKEMDGDEIDHFGRPLTVTFKQRYQALEAWSCIKKILETFQVDQKSQGVMMEAMSTLAEAIDADVKLELEAKDGTAHTID